MGISISGYSQVVSYPKEAKIIFADLENFWDSYHNDYPYITPNTLKSHYLEKISPVLKKTYVPFIIGEGGEALANTINKNLEYFENLKQMPFQSSAVERKIRKGYSKWKRKYEGAKFPEVYFAVGNFKSAGAFMNGTLAISAEMFPKVTSLVNGTTTTNFKSLPAVVLHEIVHFQQHYKAENTLLAKSIKEGAADFVTKLVYKKATIDKIIEVADPNEGSIWRRFQENMDSPELHNWLYTHDNDQIKDLGYYIGYKITESYYNTHEDKSAALNDILQIKNFKQFVTDSGYDKKFK